MNSQKALDKVGEIIGDKTKSNYIIDLLKITEETNDEDTISACVRSLDLIFHTFLERDDMFLNYTEEELPDTGLTEEEQYRVWLQKRYTDTMDRLIDMLKCNDIQLMSIALGTLLNLLKQQSYHPLTKQIFSFPMKLLQSIVATLMSPDRDMSDLITRFCDYMRFDDLRYYCMKCILDLLKQEKTPELRISNIFSIMSQLTMPKKNEDETLTNFFTKQPGRVAKDRYDNPVIQRKLYTQVWLHFLRKPLPISLYKNILLIVADKIIPNMSNPLPLADFLTTSSNIGGAISVLAINGLFTLVYYHNLDYPDFYAKLYHLLEPSIFHMKYKARFMELTDKVLSSSHLPAYLVAAFIKRLSRLALTAPCPAQTAIIPFVYNLIVRHPNCAVLLNRLDSSHLDVASDPYDMTEPDPTKCRAIESSLWEIQTLQNHAYHKVAKCARIINMPLPRTELSMEGKWTANYDKIFFKEIVQQLDDVPVTFSPPVTLIDETQTWKLH